MSDHWLRYVPTDARYWPSPAASERAVSLLGAWLADAEAVHAAFHDKVVFVDPGGNWSGVRCPACGADVEAAWTEAMGPAAASGFARLEWVTPCCHTATSLPRLRYVWPAAFGRYVLQVRNPKVTTLPPDVRSRLQRELGCDLIEVAVHL